MDDLLANFDRITDEMQKDRPGSAPEPLPDYVPIAQRPAAREPNWDSVWDRVEPATTARPDLDAFEREREGQLQRAATATAGLAPDAVAKARQLSQRSGIPSGVLEIDPEFAAELEQQLNLDSVKNSPIAEWLARPENMAVAKDDIPALQRLAAPLPDWRMFASPAAALQAPVWITARAAAQTATDPVGSLDLGRAGAAAVPRDFLGRTVSGFGQLWNLGERFLDRTVGAGLRALGVPDFDREKVPRWLRLGDSLIDTGALAKAAGDAIDVPDERKTLGTDVVAAVGQLSGQVVQGLVAPQTLAPSLLAQGADVMAERAENAGTIGTPEADAGILAGAGVTAAAERIGIARLLERVPPALRDQFARRVADIAVAGGAEAATEVVEGVAQDVLTRALIDEDFAIAEGIEREAIAAGGAGAILRAVVQGVAGRRAQLQARAEQQHVDSLVEAAGESKLRQRAPETLADMVDTAQDGRQVFIPLEALQAQYGDRTEAAVATLAGPDAYAEATASGAEVAIPLGRYVATVAQDTHAALRDHLRLTPGEEIKPGTQPPDRAALIEEAMAEVRAIDAGATETGPVRTEATDQPTPAAAMDADSYAFYLAARKAAEEQRKTWAQAERERQMEIAAERQRRHEWKDTAQQVEAELQKLPVYRAQRILTTGRAPSGAFADTAVTYTGKEGAPIRLDYLAVRDQYGKKVADSLGPMAVQRGGMTPDVAASLLGYDSGGRLVHELTTAMPLADAVRVETDSRLAAQEIDTSDPDFVDDGTDAQAKALEAEIHGLERRAGGIRTHAAVLQSVARRFMAGKEVAQIRPETYRLAEAKAAREALAAAMRQDWRAVHAARRRQLQALYLHREARAAREFATQSGKRFAQLTKKAARQRIGLAGGDFLEQLDGILARFNLAPMTGAQMAERQALADWMRAKASQGITVDVPPTIADEAFRMPLRKLKLGELRDLRDAVETIVHAANEINVLRLEGETIARQEVDRAMAESVSAHHRPIPHDSGDPTTGESVRRGALEARALTATATDIARELDGFTENGAVWSNTVRVIRQANSRANAEIRTAQEAFAALKLKHYTRQELRRFKDRTFIPEVGAAWSKERILSLALNWGNEGNREAVLEQVDRRLTPEQAGAILSRLDARDWDFVEAVWQQIGRHWSDIAATSKRRTGLAPERVPPAPFAITLPNGSQRAISGGYFPLKYEANTVQELRIADQEAYDAMRTGRFAKAATARGHTIERLGSGGRVVRLDLGVVMQHEREVIRDLRLGDAVNYVHQALHGQEFASAANAAGLSPLVNGMEIWLRDAATGEIGVRRWWERGLRMLRTNFTASVLAFKATSAALQVTGLLQSSVLLGRRSMLEGTMRFYRHPRREYERTVAASEFMRERLTTHVEAVQAVMNAEAGTLSAAHAAMIRHGYWLMGRVQATVDVATWIAAERAALERGDTEAQARAWADDVVSRAQASGDFIDKTAIQRGTLSEGMRQSEFIRATTVLQSYMTAKWNAAYERTKTADLKSVRGGLSWSMDMVSLFVVEGMVAAIIRGQWPEDEDDDGHLDDVAALAAEEGLSALLGGLPGLSVAASELRGYDSKGVFADAWGAAARSWTQIEQGELDGAFWRSQVTLAGFAFGIPSGQLNKTLQAIEAAGEGEEVSPLDYLTGPPRE